MCAVQQQKRCGRSKAVVRRPTSDLSGSRGEKYFLERWRRRKGLRLGCYDAQCPIPVPFPLTLTCRHLLRTPPVRPCFH